MAKRTIFVNTFTNGILGPDVPMTGPVADGGYIVANTAPGCWGPMLTPAIRGGHEVTTPVIVENAEVGDAIAIKIVSVQITSHGTASGNDKVFPDRCLGDPFVAGKCPQCGTLYEETIIKLGRMLFAVKTVMLLQHLLLLQVDIRLHSMIITKLE